MSSKKSLPEVAPRSPVYFGPVSNGEFAPPPVTRRRRMMNDLVHEIADAASRRLGVSRRAFLRSAGGTVAALFAINQISGCKTYDVDEAFICDQDAAERLLSTPDFIMDIQTHHVDADASAAWRSSNPNILQFLNYVANFNPSCTSADKIECFSQEAYIHEVFVNSDTTVAVLSAVPGLDPDNPLKNPQINESRDLVNRLAGSQRSITHGMVTPNAGPGELDKLQSLTEELEIAAWKTYTGWGPNGQGWALDDATGLAFLEKVDEFGPPIVCVHKGFPLAGFDISYTSPADMGPVAEIYPQMHFVAYHSGYDPAFTEGPYNAAQPSGVDRLVKTALDHGIGPNGNIYAELGGTWMSLISSPTEAAHVLGKLLLYLGEDNVLWGTDSIWFGTPQPQINAFRTFQIPEQLRVDHGYPELTPEIKAKVLGLNAAALYGVDPDALRCSVQNDEIAMRKADLEERGLVGPPVYGPTTIAEFQHIIKKAQWYGVPT